MRSNLALDGLDLRRTGKPGEFTTTCPFCPERKGSPDKKGHLAVNTTKNVYQCFRCGATGILSALKELAALSYAPSPDLDELRGRVEHLFQPQEQTQIDLDQVSWEIDEAETPIAWSYLVSRNFSPDEIQTYGLRVGREYKTETGREIRKWHGRVIFPFKEEGRTTFMVGRSYLGREPKYLNSDQGKNAVVYGIDKAGPDTIVCEGIISAIAASRSTGLPAVCFLGKRGTVWQLAKLRRKCSHVYLSLDGDVVVAETKKAIRDLVRADFRVSLVTLPHGKDPDELGEEYLEYFRRAKQINII